MELHSVRMRPLIAVGLAGALLGCSIGSDKSTANRPRTVPAAGVVTYNGQPVGEASVVFQHTNEKKAAAGRTSADGRFSLFTFDPGDGAIPGSHKVIVVKATVSNPVSAAKEQSGDSNSPDDGIETVYLIPKKFSRFETSGLRVEVPESGTTDLLIQLKD